MCVCETPLSPETCSVFFGTFALVVPFFVSTARSSMRSNLLMRGVSGNGSNLEVLLARAKPRTLIWFNLRFVIHVCRTRFLFPHEFDFVIFSTILCYFVSIHCFVSVWLNFLRVYKSKRKNIAKTSRKECV